MASATGAPVEPQSPTAYSILAACWDVIVRRPSRLGAYLGWGFAASRRTLVWAGVAALMLAFACDAMLWVREDMAGIAHPIGETTLPLIQTADLFLTPFLMACFIPRTQLRLSRRFWLILRLWPLANVAASSLYLVLALLWLAGIALHIGLPAPAADLLSICVLVWLLAVVIEYAVIWGLPRLVLGALGIHFG